MKSQLMSLVPFKILLLIPTPHVCSRNISRQKARLHAKNERSMEKNVALKLLPPS